MNTRKNTDSGVTLEASGSNGFSLDGDQIKGLAFAAVVLAVGNLVGIYWAAPKGFHAAKLTPGFILIRR